MQDPEKKDMCESCVHFVKQWCKLCGEDTEGNSHACYWYTPRKKKEGGK